MFKLRQQYKLIQFTAYARKSGGVPEGLILFQFYEDSENKIS